MFSTLAPAFLTAVVPCLCCAQDAMQEGYMSGNNSIEAMQHGEARPTEEPAGASAGPATFASSPGLYYYGHPRPRVPTAGHAHHRDQAFVAAPGMHMERSASAGSKSERGSRGGGGHRRAWPGTPEHLRDVQYVHPGSFAHNGVGDTAARLSPAQQSGVAGHRPLHHVGSRGTVDEPQLAEASGQLPPPPPVFMAPAPPMSSPLFAQAALAQAQHPAFLNVQRLLRVINDNGRMVGQHASSAGLYPLNFAHQPSAAAMPSMPIEPLLRQLSQHLSTSWQSRVEPTNMERMGSARLGGDQDDNMDAEQGGGSNSAAEQYPSGESSEPALRAAGFHAGALQHAHQQQAGLGHMLQTAGSLQRPAEGQLVDPHIHEHGRPASGSPTAEGRWPQLQQASAQEASLGPAASWGFTRSVEQQPPAAEPSVEANSVPAPSHHGHALTGAQSGAVPALSIIQGQLDPFHGAVEPMAAEWRGGADRGEQAAASGRLDSQLLAQAEAENAASVGQADAAAEFDEALTAQNSALLPYQGDVDGHPMENVAHSLGDAGAAGENCASYGAVPLPNQAPVQDLCQERPVCLQTAISVMLHS